MMIYLRKITILIIATIFTGSTFSQSQLTTGQLTGQINTITTAVPFLMIAPDARAGAMGDAGVSSSPDHSSMHWNPAKMVFSEREMGIGASYSPWLRALVPDIDLAYLSAFKKIDNKQALGLSLLYFSLGDITFTDVVGTNTGSFRPNEFAIDGGYSRKLSEKFSTGLALRYIYSNLTGGQYLTGGQATHPGMSVAADISAYYQTLVGKKKDKFAFGVNISNIGAKISYTETVERDFIPINLRLGPSYTMNIDQYNTLALMVDFNKLLVPTPPVYAKDSITGAPIIEAGKEDNVPIVTGMFNSFSDAPGGFKEEIHEINVSVGAEYWYDKQFAVRAGYFYEHATKGNRKFISFGAGLKYNVFGLDFSYLIPAASDVKSPLENTLRFTLYFDFEAFKNQEKVEK